MAKEAVKKRLPLGERQKQRMLTILLRSESAFKVGYERLLPEHYEFGAYNKLLGMAWFSAIGFYNEHEKLPTEADLLAELDARIDEDEDVTEDDIEQLDQLVMSIYAADDENIRSSVGIRLLQRFLEERLSIDVSEEVGGDVLVANLPALLEERAIQAAKIASLRTGAVPIPFGEASGDMRGLPKQSTGISFLDDYLNGGDAAAEVYGFVGPYGSCKTTLSVMLCAERVESTQDTWLNAGGPGSNLLLPRVYLVPWEEPMLSLQHRFFAYSGQIIRQSLEDGDYEQKLSRRSRGDYKSYERRLWRRAFTEQAEVPGEWERLQAWRRKFNRNLRIVDFTGATKDYRAFAEQGIDGVVAVIEQDQESCGSPGVAVVVLDYAGAAAKRKLSADNRRSDDLRHIIGEFPLLAKSKLAAAFDCPVWIMHQLGTDANSRAPGVAPTMTDAAEARNFFENCDGGFGVGVPTKVDNLCVLANVKHRRSGGATDKILRIMGEFNSVVDTRGEYTVGRGHRIVSRRDAQFVADQPSDGDVDSDGGGALFGARP